MNLDDPSDVEQSPFKMFVGLFVIFGLIVSGFAVVQWLSPPAKPSINQTSRDLEFPGTSADGPVGSSRTRFGTQGSDLSIWGDESTEQPPILSGGDILDGK